MKQQRISSRELEDHDAAAAAAAARARGFSKLTKFMKVISRGTSSSTTTPPYHNSLLRGRLPEGQSSSSTTIRELSNLRRRTELPNHREELMPQQPTSSSNRMRTRTELPNQEELPQQQPASSSSNRMYTCKTCGRQFETFQALGGHRASHKMKLVGDGNNQRLQYKEKLHRCSICDKGYQTGQALGGHMRKHRELLETQRLAVAAVEATSSSNANHQNVVNHQSNALRWAQMNAAAIFQYCNLPQRHNNNNNAPHPPAEAEAGPEEAGEEKILKEKVPTRKGINFDLNLDALENEELGLGTDDDQY